jgi:molybdate transport repressor ModE-like protein
MDHRNAAAKCDYIPLMATIAPNYDPPVDLNQLRYLQAIAASGSMTAAAKALHVSQPTITVAMRTLEERLATTLLLRERSGVRLTRTGEELLRHAREVFAILERAEQRIKGIESDDAGSFVVGCHESLGAYYLPGFMPGFLRTYPRIELSLYNDTSASVHAAVLDGRVDFGIVVNPHPHGDLVLVELFHDAMDLFVADDAPPPSRAVPMPANMPSPSDAGLAMAQRRLVAGPLIYAGRVDQCRDLLGRLAAESLLSDRQLSCGDLEIVKSLAIAGIGVALLPRRVAAYGNEGKLRRLHPSLPFFPDTISLVYRADMHRTHASMLVKDALARHGKSLELSPC